MAQPPENLKLTPEQMQQHPEAMLMVMSLSILVLCILVACIAMWIVVFRKIRRGQTILAVEPWSPRYWGLIDLLLVGFLIVAAQIVSIKAWAVTSGFDTNKLRESGDVELPLSAMATMSASYFVVILLTVFWLFFRYGASLTHIGFLSNRFVWNIGIGLAATVLCLPLVNLLMALVSLSQEYDHPLLTKMISDGSLGSYLLAFFSAVVAAPIAEEFLFRVLLQGWLQSIPFSFPNFWWLVGASQNERDLELSRALVPGNSVNEPLVLSLPNYDSTPNPYKPLASPALADLSDSAAVVEPKETVPPIWPSFVSGTIFGMAHFGYGMSFIPLIVLGIVLGLLYRATHSIWPGFVVHFALNLISMLGLGLTMYLQYISE